MRSVRGRTLAIGFALVAVLSDVAPARAALQVERSADLEVLRRDVLDVDASFSADERARADAKFAALAARADDLDDAQFELAIAELLALADNGHTGVLLGRWAEAFNRLGVRFLFADDGLFVADAVPEYEDLVGSRVLRIAGRDIDALRTAWASFRPGPASAQAASLHLFLESPDILHAAGIADSPGEVELGLAGGRMVTVGTTDAWPKPEGIWRYLPQAPEIELAMSGRIEGDPLYLGEPTAFFRFVELPERGGVYLQFRANHTFGAGDLRAEADAALERLRALGPRFVIVDQRFNFGGDLNNTRDLMEAIPDIVGPEGRVVAITSGRTFSAGIASVGYLKQAGGDRVAIVGDSVGDRLEFWAEGSPVALPGSGTLIGIATERHEYVTGCQEADCHDSIRRYPIRVESLEPELRPEVTYADVVGGRDPYLDAALELVSERT